MFRGHLKELTGFSYSHADHRQMLRKLFSAYVLFQPLPASSYVLNKRKGKIALLEKSKHWSTFGIGKASFTTTS